MPSEDDNTEDEDVKGGSVESGSIREISKSSSARGDDNAKEGNSDHVLPNNPDHHNGWHVLSGNGSTEGGNWHHRCHSHRQKYRPTTDKTDPSKPASTAVLHSTISKKINRPVDRRPPAGNLVSDLSLRQVDCYKTQENRCLKDSSGGKIGHQEIRILEPEAVVFTPASIKNRVPTSTAILPQGSGMNAWREVVKIRNEEGETIPCPSSPSGEVRRADNNPNTNPTLTTKGQSLNEGTRGPLYSFDDLPEGFPIRMGPEVDLFQPFHIYSDGMIFQHSDGTSSTLPPMGRGDSLGNSDEGRKQDGRKMKNEKQQGNQPIVPLSNWAGVNPIERGTTRDLRHQGMGHSEDTEMKTHDADHDYDETALNKTRK